MSSRLPIYICMTIGAFIGGYIPIIFGADLLSITSLFFSGIGAVVGSFGNWD